MAGSEMADETDESLTKQMLNLVLENNVLTPYVIMWVVFNVILLALLLYVSSRVSIGGIGSSARQNRESVGGGKGVGGGGWL